MLQAHENKIKLAHSQAMQACVAAESQVKLQEYSHSLNRAEARADKLGASLERTECEVDGLRGLLEIAVKAKSDTPVSTPSQLGEHTLPSQASSRQSAVDSILDRLSELEVSIQTNSPQVLIPQ